MADFLNSLVVDNARVTSADHWAPRGFLGPDEARLGDAEDFLCAKDRNALADWWLIRKRKSNTPNWDIVSSCQIGGHKGFVLIEAKAHEAELGDDRSHAEDPNLSRIKGALAEATTGWNALMTGFAFSADAHYQLSNRFAFAWKLAKMGIPVVLVYLGFLDAHEMNVGGRVLFKDHSQWRRCLLAHSKGTIPEGAWEKPFEVDGTPLTVLIRSAVVGVHARVYGDGDA